MTRVPITSPLAVLTTRTTQEHLMTTHDTTDLKSGDIVQHPEKGPGIVYTSTPMRVMHRSAFGRLSSSNLAGWERVETVRPGHVQVRVDDLDLSRWPTDEKPGDFTDEIVVVRAAKAQADQRAHRAAKDLDAQRAESTPPADEQEIVGDGCECWVTPEHMWTTYGSAVEPGSQVENNPRCPKHGEAHTDPANTATVADPGAPKLIPGQRYRDKQGDVWEVYADGLMVEKPECGGIGLCCSFDHVMKKWGPLTLIADEQPTTATVTLPCPDCGEAITREVRPVRMGYSRTPKWSLEFLRSPGAVGERSHACPPVQPDEPTEPGIRVAVCDMRLVSLMQNPTGGRLFADVKSGHIYDWDYLTERGAVTIGWDE